jgi:hypothetical protein
LERGEKLMKARLTSFALALALLGAFLMLPGSAVAQTTNPFVDIPVTGTLPGGGTFQGLLDVTGFAVQNGQLVALGNLSGTLTNAVGTVIGTVTNVPVAIPVDLLGTVGSCEILDLVLGPLDLNLLGLLVHLDQVHLNITAQSAPGNLLGNLLCAVAHLLDAPGNPLGGLAALLNGILGILQGL